MENQMTGTEPPESGGESSLVWILVIILFIFLIIAVGVIIFLINDRSVEQQQSKDQLSSQLSLVNITPAVTSSLPSILTLNKEYVFPIKDAGEMKVGEITYLIKDVQRTKEVMLAGGKAKAAAGRELIILNVELTNSENLQVALNSRDYLRLKVNDEDKLLAPEFHGDPLDLQPQSTKQTRLGFSIAEGDKKLVLQVGELQGEKELIDLSGI